jgi:hypothetical protein
VIEILRQRGYIRGILKIPEGFEYCNEETYKITSDGRLKNEGRGKSDKSSVVQTS